MDTPTTDVAITQTPPTPELGAVPWNDEFVYLTDVELRPRLKEALTGPLGEAIAAKSEVWAVRYAPDEDVPFPETALELLFAEVTGVMRQRLVGIYDVPWEQAKYCTLRQVAYSPFTPRRCGWVHCPGGSSVQACTTC